MKNYIILKKISKSKYKLLFDKDINLGFFVQDVDGYFYWDNINNCKGLYSDYILRELSEKLIELNKNGIKK